MGKDLTDALSELTEAYRNGAPVQNSLPPPLRPSQIPRRVGQAGKTGWFYVLDRRDGKLIYKSEAFVPQQNQFKAPTPEGIDIAPGGAGGASWSPVSYDERTGLAYVAALHMPMRYTVKEVPATDIAPAIRYTTLEVTPGPTWGLLSAIDTRARGRIRWQVKTPQPLVGGVVATAGGLVFCGEPNGRFGAYDAGPGERLWSFQTGAAVGAPPISYAVEGRQFVAVSTGAASPPAGVAVAPGADRPGGAVIGFALVTE